MFQNLPTAREIMADPLITFHPDEDIFDAIERLVVRKISGAPVLNDKKQLVGILTEKDCLRIVSHIAYDELEGGRVSDYLSPVKVTLDPTMDVFSVANAFLRTNFVALPVLENERYVGRINRRDVLRAIIQWFRKHTNKRMQDRLALEEGQRPPSSIERMQKIVASHKKEHVAEVFRRKSRS